MGEEGEEELAVELARGEVAVVVDFGYVFPGEVGGGGGRG